MHWNRRYGFGKNRRIDSSQWSRQPIFIDSLYWTFGAGKYWHFRRQHRRFIWQCHSLRPSMVCTRPKSYGIAVLGVVSKKYNLLHWNGWIGSTTEDCWMQSDMSHRQNLKRRIIAIGKSQLMQLDSRKYVSGNTGAIQSCRVCPFSPVFAWYWLPRIGFSEAC